MSYVIGCLIAALSFLVNRLLLRYVGSKTIISYSPLVEEAGKTLFSYYLNADILITHAVFGVVEAGYDWLQNERNGAGAALASVVGHSLFGVATILVLAISGSVWLGLAAGTISHLFWNSAVIERFTRGNPD